MIIKRRCFLVLIFDSLHGPNRSTIAQELHAEKQYLKQYLNKNRPNSTTIKNDIGISETFTTGIQIIANLVLDFCRTHFTITCGVKTMQAGFLNSNAYLTPNGLKSLYTNSTNIR